MQLGEKERWLNGNSVDRVYLSESLVKVQLYFLKLLDEVWENFIRKEVLTCIEKAKLREIRY